MRLVLAADHAGFEMKEFLKEFLQKEHEVLDVGTGSIDPVDYAPISIKAAEKVAEGSYNSAIIICGTGIGSSIAANKVKGIRAALCHSPVFARLSREHNDANILVLPGRFLANPTAQEVVEVFLRTEFSNEERHKRRIEQIKQYEEGEEL
jgi:ribose 5-phosphate isomerase B